MGIVAEFRGNLVDVTTGDEVLGYNLSDVLDALFLGTADWYTSPSSSGIFHRGMIR